MSEATLAIAFGPMPLGDAMLLRAGLRLAGITWHTAPREKCDVFFAVSLGDLPPAVRGGPRCVIAGPRRASSVPAIFLDRWPNISQMSDVMSLLRTPVRDLPAAANSPHMTAALPPSPLDRWLDEVARAETRDRMVHVSTASGPTALLDPANRCAWLAPSAVGRLAEVLGEGQVMLSSVPRGIPPSTAVRSSLAHVLWALALTGNWQPDALGIPGDRRLKLRRWPDFGSLERRDTFLHVASRLTRHPTSLHALLTTFSKDRDDLLVFLAGCRLCGWLEVTADIDDTPPPVVAPAPSRLYAAVGAIRRALGMKEASR
ncbi:hypothetical protein J2X57_003385 [Luteibacter sp. 1214]|uniref:hypothetical protein n=1 Tax=Luteibacter sp. 1214 TaxID=2817735 RepID=UPI00285A1B39|nr:hypothetical protein [Luteibacter sp. 1214]MDR6644147.1 hypothetical protein [Luteibacter sp. 1214]